MLIIVTFHLADSRVFRQRVRIEGVRFTDGQAVHIRTDQHRREKANSQQLHTQQGRQNYFHFKGWFHLFDNPDKSTYIKITFTTSQLFTCTD